MKSHVVNTLQPRSYYLRGSGTSVSHGLYTSLNVQCPVAMVKGDYKKPNPWNYTITDRMYPNGSLSTTDSLGLFIQINGVFTGGDISWHEPFDSSSETIAYNNALARLNEKVRGGLDLSVSLLEASATARMIRALGTWNRWFKGFGPKRWAKEWLGYTYGWAPLLGDIYNAAEELTRVANAKLVFESTGSAPLTNTPGSTLAFIEGQPFTYNTTADSAKCGVKIRVKLRPNQSKIQSLSRWTSLNPVSIAWETLPYSFVVDWFYDVGSYLRDYETAITYNSNFESGFVRFLTAFRMTYRGSVNRTQFGSNHSGRFVADYRYVRFRRVILTAYPFPRAPVINTDLSWRRLVSAASLLSMQLGR